ncbi:MAG: phospholipid scramblase 1 [Thelocarpon impressellum]|nr:MAG: phospholipid scramblase 1 [Thelocarpon impressellum]
MDKLQTALIVSNVLVLATGAITIAVAVTALNEKSSKPTLNTVASNLLLTQCPLSGVVANAVFIFLTSIASIPAITQPLRRIYLKLQAWMILFCALFTLIIGLSIWFETLRTRAKLSDIWGAQSVEVQHLLQERFNCCGYLDSATPPFQQDKTCPNALWAAQKSGCVGNFSNYANSFLDIVFTALFGMVALDVINLLCIGMVLKSRAERARYRLIDKKSGFNGI